MKVKYDGRCWDAEYLASVASAMSGHRLGILRDVLLRALLVWSGGDETACEALRRGFESLVKDFSDAVAELFAEYVSDETLGAGFGITAEPVGREVRFSGDCAGVLRRFAGLLEDAVKAISRPRDRASAIMQFMAIEECSGDESDLESSLKKSQA